MFEEMPTLGGDPEFFIFEKKGKKYIIITADKVLPSKHKKKRASTNGYIFFDGVQAEINPDPHHCREYVARNICYCLEDAYLEARKTFKKKEIVFAPLAGIKVTKANLKGADKECFRFGCSPDSNLYTDEKTIYPDGNKFLIRFSGGHIHLGFDESDHMEVMRKSGKLLNLIKLLDIIPGTMSVAISRGEDEVIRSQYYGKAGTYRVQKHGLEYRSLSSFWLVSPPMVSLFYGLTRDAFNIVYNGKEKLILKQVDMKKIQKIIDKRDIKKAQSIYNEVIKPFYIKYQDEIPNSPMRYDYVRGVVDDMIKYGYHKFFNPYKMLNYWSIKKPTLCEYTLASIVGEFGIETFCIKLTEKGSDMKKRLRKIDGGKS